MTNLPDSYPYLEPCLGCFENSLQALSERPGSPVFFSNGDFTLERLLLALSKLIDGADLLICCYRLEEGVVNYIRKLRKEKVIAQVTIFCTYNASVVDGSDEEGIQIVTCGMNTFLVQAHNKHRSMTVSGLFMQVMSSHSLELFVLHNDTEQQALIRKTLLTRFRKQLNAYAQR